MPRGGIFRGIAWVGFAVSLPASAQLSMIPSPTAAYTAGTTPIPIVSANGATATTLSGSGQALTFSDSMTALTVGATGGWDFWGSPPDTESATPRVLATPANETSVTIILGAPVNTFGFEIEPANSGAFPAAAFPFTATFFSGTTAVGTVSRPVTFNAAMLVAASSTTPITSVRVTAPATAGGWAMAQFRSGNLSTALASVPAVDRVAFGALALLLAAAGAVLARRAIPLN